MRFPARLSNFISFPSVRRQCVLELIRVRWGKKSRFSITVTQVAEHTVHVRHFCQSPTRLMRTVPFQVLKLSFRVLSLWSCWHCKEVRKFEEQQVFRKGCLYYIHMYLAFSSFSLSKFAIFLFWYQCFLWLFSFVYLEQPFLQTLTSDHWFLFMPRRCQEPLIYWLKNEDCLKTVQSNRT